MAETADYSPGEWKGHDFASARKSYDVHVGRSYADATAKGKVAADLVPAKIRTESPAPLIILCDVTGSMGSWPATIFSKLPYLDIEGKEYLGPDMEISFGAIGDNRSDKYPLQVRPFTKGTDLTAQLKELVIECGGGGGHPRESYELGALYCNANIETPNGKPIVIFIGDEGYYDETSKAQARSINVEIEGPSINTVQAFESLKDKAAVYLVRKPYGAAGGSADRTIHADWAKILGEDHIAMLESADRVVDVIFGILAKETDKIDYFKREIEGRQTPEQINEAYKGLNTIHLGAALKEDGKSRMALPKGKKTKHLLPPKS